MSEYVSVYVVISNWWWPKTAKSCSR